MLKKNPAHSNILRWGSPGYSLCLIFFLMEDIFKYWDMGKLCGFIHDLTWILCKYNSLFCDLSNTHYTTTLTIKENNVFIKQNGVTVVQASKIESSAHCECGLRHVATSLRTWIFWTGSDSRTSPAILKTVSINTASCHLMASRSPLVTKQPFWFPISPCLTSTLTACQLQL